MGNKNNRRYKIRKREALHNTKPKFNTPPTLIHCWKELDGLISEDGKYHIEVDHEMGNGYVHPVNKEDNDYYHDLYLSTHTFYGSGYYGYTLSLRDFGFNVQLENWDGETKYCKDVDLHIRREKSRKEMEEYVANLNKAVEESPKKRSASNVVLHDSEEDIRVWDAFVADMNNLDNVEN